MSQLYFFVIFVFESLYVVTNVFCNPSLVVVCDVHLFLNPVLELWSLFNVFVLLDNLGQMLLFVVLEISNA